MGTGLGVTMMILGLSVLLQVLDLPFGLQDRMGTTSSGLVVMLGGLLAIALSLVVNIQRSHRARAIARHRALDR